MENKIIKGDCIEEMKKLPEKSVQLAIIDPPYYRIKDDEWDNQWESFNKYLDWIEEMCLEVKRVLKENGSLYIFGDDERIAYIQVRLDKHFTFLNHLVWYKTNNMPIKYAHNHRKFCPMSERILFYSVEKSKTGLECVEEKYIKPKNPMALYLKSEIERSGKNRLELAELFPSKTGGMTGCVSNWVNGDNFPLKEQYLKIKEFLGEGFLDEQYEHLREQYEHLREQYEHLRRPFNFQKKTYEIITLPIITENQNTSHSTTKPIKLIRKFILASSNEGDIVLDCCGGSGTTALACIQSKRNYILIEKDKEYFELASKRIKKEESQKRL